MRSMSGAAKTSATDARSMSIARFTTTLMPWCGLSRSPTTVMPWRGVVLELPDRMDAETRHGPQRADGAAGEQGRADDERVALVHPADAQPAERAPRRPPGRHHRGERPADEQAHRQP